MIIERDVTMRCPHCGERVIVEARMTRLEYVGANIERESCLDDNGKLESVCYIQWDDADICGDFGYFCPECGGVVANDLEELERKVEAERGGELK